MKKMFFIIAILCAVTIQGQTYTTIFTHNGTSTTSKDSINFGFNTATIIVFNDAEDTDTMFVSTDSLFAADKTFKRVGGGADFSTILYQEISTNIIYVKFGVYPTAGKKYRVEALR